MHHQTTANGLEPHLYRVYLSERRYSCVGAQPLLALLKGNCSVVSRDMHVRSKNPIHRS